MAPVYANSGYITSAEYWRLGTIFGIIFLGALLLLSAPVFFGLNDRFLRASGVRIQKEGSREYMMDRRPKPQGDEPRSEPEIIPPDQAERRTAPSAPQMRISVDRHGTERVYVAKLRPLGFILMLLTIGILSAVFLVLLLGAFLIWIPLVGLLVAGAVIFGLLRAFFQQTK
jgi:hypothetical protein